MRIRGLEGLSQTELERELAAGGRLVFYEYCISLIVISLRRPSDVYFLRAGNRGLARGLPYTLVSLLLGWWGVPWGLIYTPLTVVTNLSGGCDVTAQVRSWLQSCASQPAEKASF
jgi:hypothetical protein